MAIIPAKQEVGMDMTKQVLILVLVLMILEWWQIEGMYRRMRSNRPDPLTKSRRIYTVGGESESWHSREAKKNSFQLVWMSGRA